MASITFYIYFRKNNLKGLVLGDYLDDTLFAWPRGIKSRKKFSYCPFEI